jgi:hypothetical protein
VKAVLTKSNNDKVAQLVRDLPITTGIGHLSPGSTRRYEVIFGSNDLLPTDAPAATLDFTTIYHDGRREFTDKQHIDLDGYRSALVFDGNDNALSKIADRLAGIERKLPEKTIIIPGIKKSCSYRGTHIPQAAKKCPNCLEWLSGSNRRISNPRISRARNHRGG